MCQNPDERGKGKEPQNEWKGKGCKGGKTQHQHEQQTALSSQHISSPLSFFLFPTVMVATFAAQPCYL